VETLWARLVSRFELLGTQPAEMTVAAHLIVERIDVCENSIEAATRPRGSRT